MSRPRVLDLFCGGGGASMGYHLAGYDVTGVDNRPQPGYPFDFVQMDAFEALRGVEGYDLIHASPPCQPYSRAVTSRSSRWNDTLGRDEPALLEPIRERLRAIGVPYVIENVDGAPLDGILLCGAMFGLDIPRHRRFETSAFLLAPGHPDCRGIAKRAAAARGWDYRDMTVTGKGRRAGTSARWGELLGIDWSLSQRALKEAIPPSYTRWVGEQMLGRA